MVDQAEHSVNYSEMVDFKDLTGSALDRQMREFGYGSTNRALLEAQGLNSSALADAVAAASASIGSIRRSALEDAALGVTSRNEALRLTGIIGLASQVGNASMLGATLGDSNILSEMDRFRSISATARWHKDLAEMNLTTIANVFGGTSKLQSAIDKIRSGLLPQMEEMSATYAALGIETHSSNLTAFAQIPALIETRHKFSAFAGISETFGVDGFGYSEVYRSIMGEWHTTLDLPERHWRDKQYRADNYKEAGVDEGLIEAPTPVAMDLAIESGLISGEVRSENRTLFIIIGSTSVSISSENVSNDTHSAVGVIERELRHFISQKLQSSFGEKWFKQRVDGAIFAKAKQTRQQSLKV